MFKFFRGILLVLSLIAAVLTCFAITGSYAPQNYLTKTYLINVHLGNLDLSNLLDASQFTKRETPTATKKDWASQIIDATGGNSGSDAGAAAASGLNSAASAAASYIGGTSGSSIIQQIEQLRYSDLGLADVYQFSYWGYCRGTVDSEESGSSDDVFDNSNVNITWCSKPSPGFKLDPVEIFKTELNHTLEGDIQGTGAISASLRQAVSYLVDNLDVDNMTLPGDLNDKIELLNNLKTASFGLLLAGAVLAVVSVIIQILGCAISPHSCCLSFLNFLYECVVFIVLLVGGAIITYTMNVVRGEINDNTDSYGVRSYLSINFYAFVWSATAAALLCLFFNLLGHCCGLFGTGRRRFRQVGGGEPEMAYDHESFSDEMSMKSGPHSSHHSTHPSHH